jgi:hypothetical protein
MRDIIWTIIIVWLVWKIIDTFQKISKRPTHSSKQQSFNGETTILDKNAQKPRFNPSDAEYVDYEEVK